jgi:predicted transcriptional regulator
MKRTETITIRLSSEMKAELAKLAKAERRSASLREEALAVRLEKGELARQEKEG